MAQVDAQFGGHHADGEVGLNLSMSLGPTPDVNSFPAVGDETAWAEGPLVITDGVETVTVTHLSPFSWQRRDGPGGIYTEVQLRDSRQRWQTRGQITGEYNKPAADGAENAQQSVRALVALCLAALGEATVDVSALPDDFYPYIRWEGAKPGVEATRLCDMAQCVLSLAADGTPKVYKLGTGIEIPEGYKERRDLGRQSRDRATCYLVRGAQNVIQRTSTLVPVGLDVDDVIKPITELSYYAEAIVTWGSIASAIANYWLDWMGTKKFECASKSVWQWFRIPAAQSYLLPVLPTICETKVEDGKTAWKKPYLSSDDTVYVEDKGTGQKTAVNDLNQRKWELDEKTGVVKFSDGPVQIMTDLFGLVYDVADVELNWAHHELQADGSLTLLNFYVYSSIPNPPADATAEIIDAEWLQLRKKIVGGTTTVLNQASLDAIAAKVLALADPGEDFADSAEVVYSGIKFIYPDGRVRRVTWHAGADGATTTLVYNTDRPPLGGARLERKIEALKRAHQAAEGNSAATRGRLSGSAIPEKSGSSRQDPHGAYSDFRPECRPFINLDADRVPNGGVVSILAGWDNTKKAFQSHVPERTGMACFLLATSEVPAGLTSLGQLYGDAFALAAGTGYAVGQCLGTVKGSRLLAANKLGPVAITRIIGVVDGNTQCRVQFTGKRGDRKIVKLSDGTFEVVESIEFDEEVFSVAAGDTPGLTVIS